jgi:HNH endonuclease
MVYLTGNRGAGKFALCEVADLHLVAGHAWHLHSKGYATRDRYPGGTVLMHREVARAPAGRLVDHINQDKLDNRRVNLRLVDQTSNAFNCNRGEGVGVSWSKQAKHWKCYLDFHRKRHYLGVFKSKEEAICARKEAEVLFYGAVKQRGPL